MESLGKSIHHDTPLAFLQIVPIKYNLSKPKLVLPQTKFRFAQAFGLAQLENMSKPKMPTLYLRTKMMQFGVHYLKTLHQVGTYIGAIFFKNTILIC